MTWFEYALISLVAFSLYDTASRRFGVGAKNPLALSVVYNLLICLYFVPLFLWQPAMWPEWNFKVVGLTALTIAVWTVFVRYEYFAHQKVEATTLAVVLKLAPAITFGLSVVWLGEVLTLSKLAGMGALMVANWVLIRQERKHRSLDKKGLKYALMVMLALGWAWTMDKVVAPWYGAVLYSMMASGLPALINAVKSKISWGDLTAEARVAGWHLLWLPLLTVVGYFALIQALILGEASRVVPVAQATTPLVMLLAVIFLKERQNLGVKLVAVMLTVAGVWAMR